MKSLHNPDINPLGWELANQQETSPFDYIIVGSGAGGGPLACRLVEAGKKVLLVEAGPDPKIAGEVHDAPLFHGASTEDPRLAWEFSVRHYTSPSRQADDHKYEKHKDADGTGGIFYPRSSGIGGCTSHHAMIVIRPNDRDWDAIADLTNDDSWQAKDMQPYFAKFERCLYVEEYRSFLANLFGIVSRAWFAIIRFLNPKPSLDQGGHGDRGWQPTSFISPRLIQKILKTDSEFAKVLLNSAFRVIEGSGPISAVFKRILITLGFVRAFDPNDVSTRASNPTGGVFLIPTGIGGADVRDEAGHSLKGRRAGVREYILKTQAAHPDRLTIASGFHVTRILFDRTLQTPRAIGVAGMRGNNLYEASPLHTIPTGTHFEFYVRPPQKGASREWHGEVILCGGSFNTPQLLMLSGIGDSRHIKSINNTSPLLPPIEPLVHLPGVGRNLQDRYEVGLVSELRDDLKALDTVSFVPGDPSDQVRLEWVTSKEGLYATNGGTIAIVQRSKSASEPEPDLFAFGAPAAFRGYYWNWSKELFKPTKGAPNDQRNIWTWVILKAYTRNNGGTVRLRTTNPFATPAICFNSFDDTESRGGVTGWEKDVEALAEAVQTFRGINAACGSTFVRELQPKGYLDEKNAVRLAAGKPAWSLTDWIKNEAWGHHACGTCRMGSDKWTADASKLNDKFAVIDSRFRVHGVEGLRVVDASVFPKIPGYFILAPIFMVSEKAADTLLKDADSIHYPEKIRQAEVDAIHMRRNRAYVNNSNEFIEPNARNSRKVGPGESACELSDTALFLASSGKSKASAATKVVGSHPTDLSARSKEAPSNVVGLALSGGGVRSATFSLGVLQALSELGRLRHLDYLSTVSGGAFTGAFLGRLFLHDRVATSLDPCGRAQDILKDNNSGALRWLRRHANYLLANGASDALVGIGVFFRNLFTVHLIVGALLFAFFGALVGVSQHPLFQKLIHQPAPFQLGKLVPGFSWTLSPWWWAPLAMLVLVILPMKIGYWLAPKRFSYRSHPPFGLAAWLVLIAGGCAALALPGASRWAGSGLFILLLSWLWQEAARHDLPDLQVKERRGEGEVVRNRLSRGLGETLVVFVGLIGWVVLDSFARSVAHRSNLTAMIGAVVALAPALQLLRTWALRVLPRGDGPSLFTRMKIAAVAISFALLFLVDIIAHRVFQDAGWITAWSSVLVALLFSAAVGRAFDFLNLSSLHSIYAARIRRTFLGASNDARTQGKSSANNDVQIDHSGDDLPHALYVPETCGGPLHLISMCVNETVDHTSQREIRERKGVLMTIGSFGVSVGRRYFARWSTNVRVPRWLQFRRWLDGTDMQPTTPPSLEAVRVNADPTSFHPLARRDDRAAVVQSLSVSDWVAISGAAFSTGRGRSTTLLESLFMGLTNVRLGYWWDSGIRATERPGRYPANIWRRLKELPGAFFRMHELLLSEWRARFDGPSRQYWNLSDGGHLENTAVYELIRRRVPYIICTDATRDLDYSFEDHANLVRQVRVDFGAEIHWIPNPSRNPVALKLPKFFEEWIELEQLGSLEDLKGNPSHGGPGKRHAALARVTYANPDGTESQEVTWILLIKASLIGNESLDVTQFARSHTDFPQDSTSNQTYDDEQWESYRKLGYQAALSVLKAQLPKSSNSPTAPLS